ncbi:MAG: hypothetical protein AABY18_05910 [Candidatus Thermoplasmatota archaeon]
MAGTGSWDNDPVLKYLCSDDPVWEIVGDAPGAAENVPELQDVDVGATMVDQCDDVNIAGVVIPAGLGNNPCNWADYVAASVLAQRQTVCQATLPVGNLVVEQGRDTLCQTYDSALTAYSTVWGVQDSILGLAFVGICIVTTGETRDCGLAMPTLRNAVDGFAFECLSSSLENINCLTVPDAIQQLLDQNDIELCSGYTTSGPVQGCDAGHAPIEVTEVVLEAVQDASSIVGDPDGDGQENVVGTTVNQALPVVETAIRRLG